MKCETLIIGGGLSGLLCGISLAGKGRSVAIISAGQSALHFSSGSFELVDDVTRLGQFDASHPYGKMGEDAVLNLAREGSELLSGAGIKLNGATGKNHYRLTPIGMFKPAWMTLDDYAMFDSSEKMPWSKIAIVNLEGYLDFYPKFLANGLEKKGVNCEFYTINLPQLEALRRSSTEMRATNIARVLVGDALSQFAEKINASISNVDAVLLPAVVGLFESAPVDELRAMVNVPLYFVPTMPASVPGVRTQIQLRNYFQSLGGIYQLGDNVNGGVIEGGRLKCVSTINHGDMQWEAENFVLATGSFFSHGLIASADRVYEPILGLDVDVKGERTEWYDKDLYKTQPYMKFGVATDGDFHAMLNGKVVENLYAIGSVLSGQNPIQDGTGGGIAITTALHVAGKLINS